MPGTKEGAQKGALTNKKKYGEDYYKKIGSKSWTNPERSHLTGFALKSPEERAELGRKGGLKTKDDYKKEEYEDPEDLANFLKEQYTSTGE